MEDTINHLYTKIHVYCSYDMMYTIDFFISFQIIYNINESNGLSFLLKQIFFLTIHVWNTIISITSNIFVVQI